MLPLLPRFLYPVVLHSHRRAERWVWLCSLSPASASWEFLTLLVSVTKPMSPATTCCSIGKKSNKPMSFFCILNPLVTHDALPESPDESATANRSLR